jgi:hypothetical protein
MEIKMRMETSCFSKKEHVIYRFDNSVIAGQMLKEEGAQGIKKPGPH